MTDEQLIELKACPFCGEDEELRVNQPPNMYGYWVVHCGCCGGEMQGETRGAAVAGWNTRPPSTQADDEAREALEESYAAMRWIYEHGVVPAAKTFLERQCEQIDGLTRRLARKLEAIATEASGRDGETRLDAQHGSAGQSEAEASPRITRP